MKRSEIYDKHADHRKKAKAPKRKLGEGRETGNRHERISFKNYVRSLEEELLENDLGADLDDDLDDDTV